jgi:DNA invertase Pin-like site-specific DNA recombinase
VSGLPWGLFARVSRDEQVEEGQSIDAQLRALRAWAVHNGHPYREFVDAGVSAYTENLDKRPEFKKMLEAQRQGELGGIAVTHIDRFSRKLIVTLMLLGEFGRRSVGFIALEMPGMDYSTPAGHMMLVQLGAFAEYYSAELSRKVKRGQSERAGKGLIVGKIPFGYCNGSCHDCKAKESACAHWTKIDIKDPAIFHDTDADGVRYAFELYNKGGQSDRTIADALNALGYRSRTDRGRKLFNQHAVLWLLKNPTYAGFVVHNGKELPGKHPPIITRALYDEVQALRAKNFRRPSKSSSKYRVYFFSGMMYCAGCSQRMRANATANGTRGYMCRSQERKRGECPKSQGFVKADPVEEQFAQLLVKFRMPHNWRVEVLEALTQAAPRDVEADNKRIRGKLERIKILFEEGDKPLADYRRERDDLRAQLQHLEPVPPQRTIDAGAFLETLGTVWIEANPAERRDLIRALLVSVVCDPDEKRLLKFTPKPIFVPFFRGQANLRESNGIFEFICE